MSLSYLDEFDRLTWLRVSSAERCLFSKAGYHGLGHALLSESALPLLWSPVSSRIVGQKWRHTRSKKQALCRACGRSIALNTGTAYFELDAPPELFETAIRALAEGNSLRATGRIVQIDKDTACAWLHRAALHCRLVMLSL
jgi:hypothetical protein